jgi:type IV secretory pathway TrbL component
MKILFSVLLTLALAVAVLAQSQDTSGQSSSSQSSTSQSGQSQSGQASQGQSGQGQNQSMTGKVSKDRKSFTSDKDNKTYTVGNPDALQGQEGQHVSMLVAVDPDTNTIHIVQLEAPPQ